ncbi:hypothetical protein H257_09184 [Aphanomyces astaci]|uniref:Uncharacterized protein n=1 Tax=Aphanomyces astaci TaxID=112090 RepID=W4GCB4_APHAT|nr:hypothetical protein H257_09184 [Aphanomyces astaci]ETV76709.1 hypothetical protein H257_09184 [Aphanomyces astaci]|eukprot:XP_009833621.1 hypothetical protein H257_09184 [Aphanomyces astaci]
MLETVMTLLRQGGLELVRAPSFSPATLVVDCTFTGNVDTSTLRVHMVDAFRTQLVTYTMQTLRAVQPLIHQDEACVLVATQWTNLTALRSNPSGGSEPSVEPTYAMQLGSHPTLERVDVVEAVCNAVEWTVRTQNGTIYDVFGMQGVYFGRGTDDLTMSLPGHTMQFMWARDHASAMDRLTTMTILHQTTISHSFAWIQALVVVGSQLGGDCYCRGQSSPSHWRCRVAAGVPRCPAYVG